MDIRPYQQPDYFIATGSHHLGISDLFRLSLRIFRTNPTRTFLTIAGMAMGTGTVLFLVSLGYGLQDILLGRLASTEESVVTIEAYYPPESNLSISAADVESLSRLPEVDELSTQASFSGEVKLDGFSGETIVNVVQPNYFRLSGLVPEVGAGFGAGEQASVVSRSALRLLNIEGEDAIVQALGKEISLQIFQTEEGGEVETITDIPFPLRIKGVLMDEVVSPLVIMPYDAFPEPPVSFQRIFLKAKDLDAVEPLRDKLIDKGFLISARIDIIKQARAIMTTVTVVLGVFGVASLIVSALGMFNTMIIGFLERIFEVGIMKAVGATSGDIRNLFLMESFIMGLAGGIGGIAGGIGGGELFNLGLNILAERLGGKPIHLFVYPPLFLLFILVLSACVGLLAGFWPARRAAQLTPREAFTRK